MAKFTILAAALFLALVTLAKATSHTTTITTTLVEEENPRGRPECGEQIRRMPLRHCSMYLSQGSPYEVIVMNPGREQKEQHLSECCRELEKIDEQCRCEAIREMLRQPQLEGDEMKEMAQYLPRKCQMGPPQCRMRAIRF